MNSNDQAQFAKDVYQVPTQPSQAEFAATPELSSEGINQEYADVARHEISLRFDEITKEMARSASGVEAPKGELVEVREVHADAVEILQNGSKIKAMRHKRHAELIEIQTKRGFTKILSPVLGTGTFDSEKIKQRKEAILHDLIEQESKAGVMLFPTDPDVASRKFFLLPSENYDEWFHQQTSLVRSKDFTNSYIVTQYGIQKSSTFFDEAEGRVKNVSVVPDGNEIKNLKLATAQSHQYVAKKVYAKPTSSRRLFGLKSNDDLAA